MKNYKITYYSNTLHLGKKFKRISYPVTITASNIISGIKKAMVKYKIKLNDIVSAEQI